MNQNNIAVLIPCYNEERSIIAVVDEIFATLPDAKIYVFDNNSTDKSADLVRAKIAHLMQDSQTLQDSQPLTTPHGGGGESPISSLRGARA